MWFSRIGQRKLTTSPLFRLYSVNATPSTFVVLIPWNEYSAHTTQRRFGPQPRACGRLQEFGLALLPREYIHLHLLDSRIITPSRLPNHTSARFTAHFIDNTNMSSKTTVSPRSSSAYATQEMEIMAAFLCKNKVECNSPADFHADISNHKSPSSVTAFDKRYGSPRSPGYIFSISTMEKNEEPYGPDLVEFGSPTNQGRAGLIRTASLKDWMDALSRENLVETAIEKLKRQESDGHGRNWFEFRDREEAICCSEVFTPGTCSNNLIVSCSVVLTLRFMVPS